MSHQLSAVFKPGLEWMHTATFPGRFESLTEISEFVTRAAEEAGLSSSDIYAVDLAVDEACTNIIEHAYGGEGNGNIQCTYEITDEALIITLRDRGKAFNPSKIKLPNFKVSLKELKSGGAGLFLIRKLMDEVLFDYSPESGNTLKLIKRKS